MSNGYWQDIKNLFKSKQRLKEEEAQAVGEAVKREQSILDRLKALEEEYQATIKDTTPAFDELFAPVSLARVSYDKPSDEEIKRTAEDKISAKYSSKVSDIDTNAFDKAVELSEQREDAAVKKAATLLEVEQLFEALKEKAKDDGIKRGIQRSSIFDGTMTDIDEGKSAEKASAESGFLAEIESIDGKLADLETQRTNALKELDLQRAVELTETITTLEKEREKTVANEATKNNAIEKQEAELNAKLQKEKEKFITDYYTDKREDEKAQAAYEREYGYSGAKQQSFADRYNVALEFYLTVDPDIAPKALAASGNMKHYLGNYYDKLMGVLEDRASKKKGVFI